MSKGAKKDFQDISWSDLESWAGAKVVSRGKAYHRSKLVRDLAITEAGDLVAWVSGSTAYATKVSIDNGSLASVCTCPYLGACKHAVAVVLEYLDCIEDGKDVPLAHEKDERLLLTKDASEYSDDEDDLHDEDEGGNEVTVERSKHSAQSGIDDYLGQKSKEELLSLISGIISRSPEIREELNYKAQITHGKPSALVRTVEREILKTSSEPGWRNYWKHTGYTPDYSRVRSGLQKLLEEGQADEVVRLGEKLFMVGIDQVEQSHDEGETADEVASALNIVFHALAECSLPSADKLERAVDFELRDEYGLCQGVEAFWKRRFSKKNWGVLADRLLGRLGDPKCESPEDSFSRDYRRDRLTDQIISALENAGRRDAVLSLCKQEAERTRSYVRLVKHLRKAGRTDEAEEWIRKGIAAALKKSPGIAESLKDELLEIRSLRKDWAFVAALRAGDFIEHQSFKAFEDLKKSSEKAKVWPPVREAVLHFLETGKYPNEYQDWPLPDTEIEISSRTRTDKPPFADVLIDIAIHEKRIDDVLKWFEIYRKKKSNWPDDHMNDDVATAIAHVYSDKAVTLWKELAESHISVTNVSSYSMGAQYLRKAQKILKQKGKEAEWNVYLQGLKEANRRKPRCVEILNALSEAPIIKIKREG